MDTELKLRDYSENDNAFIEKTTEPLYLDKFKEFEGEEIKIILLGNTAVGWAHVHMPGSSLYSGFIFIYIIPEYRRKGIGTWVYRQAEAQWISIGCNWWTSYPASEGADRFSLAVGFDYTNTNLYMEHSGVPYVASTDGIRQCRPDDFSAVSEIWTREYADMHRRIGLPYETHEFTEEDEKEAREDFLSNLKNKYVIEADGKIVGQGGIFRDNSGIGSLAVDRAYAGHGYGTRLAAFLTNEIIRRGNDKPCLYCELGNDDALHVYRKIGYREVSRETVALKN
jgi:predicted GNAT family acetyltransferase